MVSLNKNILEMWNLFVQDENNRNGWCNFARDIIVIIHTIDMHPSNYTFGSHFVVFCCGLVVVYFIHIPTSTLLVLDPYNHCASEEATLKDMGK